MNIADEYDALTAINLINYRTMKITKAKITKDNTLVVTYSDDDENIVTVEGKNIVHSDLRDAFAALTGHMAILCELREAKEDSSPDELKDLRTVEVTGYSIGGSDDEEGATLIGKRFLKSKKVLNLIAPFTKFHNENEEYPYSYELMDAVNLCNYEVEQYLTAKKWSFVQQDLPFDEEEPKAIAPDSVEDAPFDHPGTNTAATFIGQVVKEALDKTSGKLKEKGVTMTIHGGTSFKPRRSRKKKEIAS